MTRTYTELSKIQTFEERYAYLRVHAGVGIDTFGYERWLNQAFYTSTQWRRIRQRIIARDLGNDLGFEGYGLWDKIIIHHMNPIRVEDITHANPEIFDPEFLISTSMRTHNAIHFGDESGLPKLPIQRRSGDTKLW